MIGKQVQLRGRGFKAGMRVSFRWSRGALATKLRRSPVGLGRPRAGRDQGRDDLGARHRPRRAPLARDPRSSSCPRRSSARPRPSAARCRRCSTATACGSGSCRRARAATSLAIAARARAAGIVDRVRQELGRPGRRRGRSSTRRSSQALHAQGLHVCAWQFVYGDDPLGEAAQGASAVAAGADCLVIDAETHYEGKYAQAQQYVAALRAAVGPAYPIGLTSFPYVDYHPRLPYSVFLGAGRRAGQPAAGLLEGHRRDRRRGQRAHVAAQPHLRRRRSRRSARPTRRRRRPRSQRFRQVWAAYGSGGLSWWSWQATGPGGVGRRSPARRPPPVPLPDPGWPALDKGTKGDEVDLAAGAPRRRSRRRCRSTATFGTATAQALAASRPSRGLPPTGETDAATWQAVLALPVQPVDWVSRAAAG